MRNDPHGTLKSLLSHLLKHLFREQRSNAEMSDAAANSTLINLLKPFANDQERERLIFSDETQDYINLDDFFYDIDACVRESKLPTESERLASSLLRALRSVNTAPELDIGWTYQNGTTTHYLRPSGIHIPDPRRHYIDFLRNSQDWQTAVDSAKALHRALTNEVRITPHNSQ